MKKPIVWIWIVTFFLLAIGIPYILDWCIIGNEIPSNISNSDWVGFLGGYIGAILGALFSLAGIAWTIKFTREQNRADRELQIRPYFDIRYIPSVNTLPKDVQFLGYVMINEYDDNGASSQDVERGLLYLKNVGNGPATNIDIAVSVEHIQVKYSAKFNNKNTKVTTNSVISGEESAISFIVTNNSLAPSKNDLTWDENGFADYNPAKFQIPSGYDMVISLNYNDLLGNNFDQQLKFAVTYEMSYDKETGGKYLCNLHLTEKGIPQKK